MSRTIITQQMREHPCVNCHKIDTEFLKETMVMGVLIGSFRKTDLQKYLKAVQMIKDFTNELYYKMGIK